MRKFFYVTALYLLPLVSFAQGVTKLTSPTPAVGTLFEFVTAILNIVIRISIPVITLSFIWTGYLFVSASGDPAKLKTARGWLIGSFIGAIVILSAVIVATIVKNTIGQLGG
ncbi:MAG: hypothetical protein NT098_00900 [Candidatus Parcubacteria bacterium]|nr:hypothetical protein [Candidatus Parcubacteria bacterium]